MNGQALPGERQVVSKTVIGLGLLLIIAGAALGAAQAYKWYSDGYWTPYATARLFTDIGIPVPHGAWDWVQPTIDWLMYEPAWGVLLSGGLVLAAIGRVIRGLTR